MSKLFCSIRQRQLVASPEEKVRQRLICYLIEQLGFPKSSLWLEGQLSQLPHLINNTHLPDRRFDILCMITKGEGLLPLLMVECKAVKLTDAVLQQVLGYNHYVQAPFVAIANQEQLIWGRCTEEGYQFAEGLPSFQQLKESIL